MSDWTAGYVADIDYTYGYYTELNPLRAKLAFLSSGFAFPEVGAACELGFGQGLSANVHAAASVIDWHGTDFNPAHAGFAQSLAGASGAKAHWEGEGFAEFCNRTDLPDFDYIGLHGIWSWISDENRHVIVDFVRRKLKVGGVLYLSYNAMPGWTAFAPMRHLMTQHAGTMGSMGAGIVSRIEGALTFVDKLLETNPAYARVNPALSERLGSVKQQSRNYLAHEYFNRDWHPMYFSTIAEWLTPAKVNFACSAHYLDHVEAINLTPEQRQFMSEIPDAMLRESVRDFMLNQQFRKDYWVKGARKLNLLERSEALRAQRVVLVTHRPDVSLKSSGPLGEITMIPELYNAVLDVLADHAPRTIGEVEATLAPAGLSLSHLVEVLMVLTGTGDVVAAQADDVVNRTKTQTSALNAALMDKARWGNDIGVLASPVTGGGFAISRFHQLFVHALSAGKTLPGEWAAHAWAILKVHGEAIVKDGAALEGDAANMAEITMQAETFAVKLLPVVKSLQIV